MNLTKSIFLCFLLSSFGSTFGQSTGPDSRCPDCYFVGEVVEANVISYNSLTSTMLISLTPLALGPGRGTYSVNVGCGLIPQAGNIVLVAISGVKKYAPRNPLDADHCYVNATLITSVSHVCEFPEGLQSTCPDDFPFVW